MDDYFPCISKARGPAFTKGKEGELWVMLLEKAWAKINGSYDAIESGLTRECLHDFTGAPTMTLWLDEEKYANVVWSKLLEAEKSHYVMTCGSSDSHDDELLKKNGIVKSHAYSLLGAFELKLNNEVHKLVKLRNPWGDAENSEW